MRGLWKIMEMLLYLLLLLVGRPEAEVEVPLPVEEVVIGELRPCVVEDLDVALSIPAAAQVAGPEELAQDWDDMDSYWWELCDCLDFIGQEEFAYTLVPKLRFEAASDTDSLFVGYAATQKMVDDPTAITVENMETMSEQELDDLVQEYARIQRSYPIENLSAQAALYRNAQAPYIGLYYTDQTEDGTVWIDLYMTDYKGVPYVFVFWGTELADRVRAEAIMDTVVLEQSGR